MPLERAEHVSLRTLARGSRELVAMGFGLLYWVFFGGLLTLIGGPLYLILPERAGKKLGRIFLNHLFRWFVAYVRLARLVYADTSALDRLGKSSGSFIVAPNHLALWDAVFIIARLPQAVCIMKKAVLHNPLLGGGARLAGYIANDGTTRMIRNAAISLTQGGQLLLFPEGTRTKPDARWINPLKGGCAIIALRAGVPIYPVFIRSNTRFMEKGWPPWKRPIFPIHIRMELGEPLTALPGETPQSLTRRLEEIFQHELSRPHPLRRRAERTEQTSPE